jgi:serine/threonine protein kinase
VDTDGQGIIAVKLLNNSIQGVDGKEFNTEFNNLTKLKHPNIVQLVGYCNEEYEVPIQHNGRTIMALTINRALCFEYMHNGSLEKHLYGTMHGSLLQVHYLA